MSYAVALMVLAMLAWLWAQALRLRDLALRGCRRACQETGVQLLDESVALARVDLQRSGAGRRLRWWYDFHFSVDGRDRHRGSAALVGGRVEAVRLEHPEGVTWVARETGPSRREH